MSSSSAQYAAVLAQERDRVREFLELLQREQAALVAGDHDELMAFTEQKAAHILDLRRVSDTRSRLLAAHGLRADKDGMSAWIENFGDEPMRRTWDEIKALAAQVRAANEINGALVAARLKHNQAAIAALQAAARGGPGVYGPDGATRLTTSTTRALARA
ncbi:MAG: flagellar protein FlgN [Burkholderiales bacterium]|nr:flagellar protein FlgN [Burkholderiales bacterium]